MEEQGSAERVVERVVDRGDDRALVEGHGLDAPVDVRVRRLDAAVGGSVQQPLERRPRGRQVAAAPVVREARIQDPRQRVLERLVRLHPAGLRGLGRIDRSVEDEVADAIGMRARVSLRDDRPVADAVDGQAIDAERRADGLDVARDVLRPVGREPGRVGAGLDGAAAGEIGRERGRRVIGRPVVPIEVPRALAQLGAARPARVEREDVVLPADRLGQLVDEVVGVEEAALARPAVDEQERAELVARGRRDRVGDVERRAARVADDLVALHRHDVAGGVGRRARPTVGRALGRPEGRGQRDGRQDGDDRATPRDRGAASRDGDVLDPRDRHRLAVRHVVHEPEREARRGDRQDAAEDRPGGGCQHHRQRPRERPRDEAGDEDDQRRDGQHADRARQASPGAGPGVIPGRGLSVDPGGGEQHVALARVHDAEAGQHHEVRPHGPAPAAPHPERHDDRDQQPDPERSGEAFELGGLRDGDEVRVEVPREDRPRPDRDHDDGDRQDHDQRQDDAQALGARRRGRHRPRKRHQARGQRRPERRDRLDQRRVGGSELLGRAVGDVRPLVDGRLVSGRRGRRSPRAPCGATR